MRALLTSGLIALATLAPAWAGLAVEAADAVDADKAAMVKTGYLYNYVKLVSWPDGAVGRGYVVGIVGDHPFGRYLAKLASQKVDGKPVHVRRYEYGDDLDGCNLVYLGVTDAEAIAAAVEALDDAPVLTVSEHPGFAGDGGMVELYLDGDRIGMRIDLARAVTRGLRLSPRILSAAEIIAD